MTELDRTLERRILASLAERGPGKTICPSDVARSVYAERSDAERSDAEQLDPEGWRALMAPTRAAAGRLVQAGEVVVTQKGEVVEVGTARGPIRIRRA